MIKGNMEKEVFVMRKFLVLLAVIVLVALEGCRKPYDYIEPELYSISVDVEGTSATVVARVNFSGEKFMYVDVGKKPDLSDAKRYEMNQNDYNKFNVTIKDLDFGSKYYFRIEAGNVNFSIFSDVKSVDLSETMIFYGDNSRVGYLGYADKDNVFEWAVMFLPAQLALYKDANIIKVRACVGCDGQYTLAIYKDGTTSPNTVLITKQFYASSAGWQEIDLSPLPIETDTPLWVSISTSQGANKYPLVFGNGIGQINSRWIKYNNGQWRDWKEWADSDLCWLIQAVVKADVKGEKGCEIELPLNSVDLCEHK